MTIALLALLSMLAASPQPVSDAWRKNLPAWARTRIEEAEAQNHLAVTDRLNPYYLQADFNGDRKLDLAVLVKSAKDGKQGILILFRDRPGSILLGAGSPVGAGGDDFSWMDVWSVYSRESIQQGAGEGAPPRIRGDALLVEKSEAASAILYWDGRAFRWYQLGD